MEKYQEHLATRWRPTQPDVSDRHSSAGGLSGAERVERQGAVTGLVVLVYSRPGKSALAPTSGGPVA